NPTGVGDVADKSYSFTWIDGDMAPRTSTTTIDFFYTPTNPPTYVPGTLVQLPGSKPIREEVRLNDTKNVIQWDTSQVPSGTYWLWSRVTEVPVSNPQKIITFSPGVVTIAHAGDDVRPAIVIAPRADQFHWPSGYEVEIGYWAFDPQGTGTVRLEAAPSDSP